MGLMTMPSRVADQRRLINVSGAWLRLALQLVPLLLLAACASSAGYRSAGYGQTYAPTHYYPPPGPPDDPWGPYINEAAARYGIPGQWIRAVMQQESGGEEQAVSPVGAMGLMQLTPETYQGLEASEGLGEDPFDPHNNILAGAAYIKQMYDRFGSPGFLAAYNAGPADLDAYLAGAQPLPAETVNYLAAVTPNLGTQVAASGPLANYAAASGGYAGAPNAVNFATGCDVNAAYDPDHPCAAPAAPSGSAAPVVLAVNDLGSAAGSCDLDAAYDPDSPCTPGPSGQAGACSLNAAYDPASPCNPAPAPVPQAVVQPAVAQLGGGVCDPDAAYDPAHPCAPSSTTGAGSQVAVRAPARPVQASPVMSAAASRPFAGSASALYQPGAIQTASASMPMTAAATPPPSAGAEQWAIQVGAFSTLGLARTVAEGARAQLPGELAGASIALPATTPFGGLVLYRARLVHLSASEALAACVALSQRQLPCVVLRGAAS
jgi:D-alanyl-D-alanine carboxypeptidase